MLKLLVTGGMGFIGCNFIRYMLTKYDDVHVTNLDKLSVGSNPANLKDVEADNRYRFVKGDITDRELVKTLVNQTDVIVNIAAETHVDRSISNPEPFFNSNTLGTFTLLEAARKADIEKFLHISTDEIYGTARGTKSFKEKDALNPSNPTPHQKPLPTCTSPLITKPMD